MALEDLLWGLAVRKLIFHTDIVTSPAISKVKVWKSNDTPMDDKSGSVPIAGGRRRKLSNGPELKWTRTQVDKNTRGGVADELKPIQAKHKEAPGVQMSISSALEAGSYSEAEELTMLASSTAETGIPQKVAGEGEEELMEGKSKELKSRRGKRSRRLGIPMPI
ncbi:hypothetical protein B0H19DRAFT_1066552 [Mycena capillaripes]|nr:hypothetical protein B0H19DRAFT_1066552 [Mycena capillaripes]